MCDRRQCCCRNEDELKGRPEDCTPEQIRKCHGDEQEHPCEKSDDEQ
jgi:hypothetical protein